MYPAYFKDQEIKKIEKLDQLADEDLNTLK